MKRLFLHQFQQNSNSTPQFFYTSLFQQMPNFSYALINNTKRQTKNIIVYIKEKIDNLDNKIVSNNNQIFLINNALGFENVEKIKIQMLSTVEASYKNYYNTFLFRLKTGFENVRHLHFFNCGSEQFYVLSAKGAPNIKKLIFENCGLAFTQNTFLFKKDEPEMFRSVEEVCFLNIGGSHFHFNFDNAFGNVEYATFNKCGYSVCIFSKMNGFQNAKTITIKKCPKNGFLKIYDTQMFNSIEQLNINDCGILDRPNTFVIEDPNNILPPEKIEILFEAILKGKNNGLGSITLRVPNQTPKIRTLAQELKKKSWTINFI